MHPNEASEELKDNMSLSYHFIFSSVFHVLTEPQGSLIQEESTSSSSSAHEQLDEGPDEELVAERGGRKRPEGR